MKRWQITVLAILAALLCAWWLLKDNFHSVITGDVYRSAQLNDAKLAAMIARQVIRTVVSLQRPRPDKRWLKDELAAAAQAGAEHHDVGLDLTFSPRIDHLLELRNLLENEYVDLSGNVHFLVDPIRSRTWWRPWGRINDGIELEVSRAESPDLELSGWAFDTRYDRVLQGVALTLGGVPFGTAEYGVPQPWLIDDFGKQAWIGSGWRASLPLAGVPDGCHELLLSFTRLDGSAWTTPPAARICIR